MPKQVNVPFPVVTLKLVTFKEGATVDADADGAFITAIVFDRLTFVFSRDVDDYDYTPFFVSIRSGFFFRFFSAYNIFNCVFVFAFCFASVRFVSMCSFLSLHYLYRCRNDPQKLHVMISSFFLGLYFFPSSLRFDPSDNF